MKLNRPRNYSSMAGDGGRKRATDFEVRCIVELDDDECYRPKKSKSSNQSECPYMKARLYRHLQQHHSSGNKQSKRGNSQLRTTCNTDCQTHFNKNASKVVTEREVLTEFFGNSIALSPSISMNDALCNLSCQSSPFSFEKPKTSNHGSRKFIEELFSRNKSHTCEPRETRNEDVRQTETVILLPRGHYKDNLQTVILQWLLEIPVFPNIDQASKIIRDNAVNELNEAIYNLSTDINNEFYETNVKMHIHEFLEGLPIWFPCSMRDHKSFKNELESNLFERIKRLNKELFHASIDKKTYVRNCSRKKTGKADTQIDSKIVEQIVINYLSNLTFIETDDWGYTINIQKVKDEVIKQLKPVMKIMTQIGNNKLFLKTELITILKDIPLANDELIDTYAQDLADQILTARANKHYRQSYSNPCVQSCDHIEDIVDNNNGFTEDIIRLINTVIDINNSGHKDELVSVIVDSFDSIRSGNINYAKDEIFEFLCSCYDITEQNALILTNKIIEKMKHAVKSAVDKSCSPMFLSKDSLTKSVLVFVSDHDLSASGPSDYPITSTPNKSSSKKEITKLNPEERKYIQDISKLINSWLETVPELAHVHNDKNYKELIVFDLAGQLTDEMKLEQYGPNKDYLGTRENWIKYTVMRWMIKFEEEAYQNMNEEDMKSYLNNFYSKFSQFPVPVLTIPHHGTRKYEKASMIERKDPLAINYHEQEIIDMLEDEISIWMNEQPSNIYSIDGKDARNKMLHDFALKVQDQLQNKSSNEDIKRETKVWLDKILKPNEKKNIDQLSEMLKERILKIQLNETLKEERKKENLDKIAKYRKDPDQDLNTKYDHNKTLIKLVDKFIEHNFGEDDILVKGAYSELLKNEFKKLSPSSKAEMNLACCGTRGNTTIKLPEELDRELRYIKMISDWLNDMPIDSSFNVPGNSARIDLILGLAHDIRQIEMLRMQGPEVANFEQYLAVRVRDLYMPILPIAPSKISELEMISNLIYRVEQSRDVFNQPTVNKNQTVNNSFGIKEQNLDDFIDEYIRINGKEIVDDPLKLEVWTARLLKEINRMVQTTEPSPSFQLKAYDRLANIPIPSDESVIEFNRKLMYAHEIGDWIKNMPLQVISDQETKDMIAKMISDLAQELFEKHANNLQDDPELVDFVIKWITTLPLEPTKEIDVSVLIQQLANRIKRVNEGTNQNLNDSNIKHNNENIPKPIENDTKNYLKTKKLTCSTCKNKVGPSRELVVNAIEDWCNNLPINEENKDCEKAIKDNVAKKLFQKVGDLSFDPRLNDDVLYQDILGDEIDKITKELQYDEVQKNKENLKSSLLNDILEARAIIKEQTAGEHYRRKLENTIEASIPVPISNKKIYDPGFEIYKNKLTNMFILENFDHGDDAVKLKHEVRIKDEIDKYFHEAQKRNAVPLSRDEIYNELYSALFKVPVPNENSVIQEVEEVKLRCEIDGWFEKLPIREATNLNELLDWDKILEMLAKRIYEIENNEPQAEDKIHKEITKWLVKFPLLPGEENNIDKHAKSLEDILKSTKNERKCVPKSTIDKVAQKGKSLKNVYNSKNVSIDKSQAAGPSGAGQSWSSPKPCCIAASTPRKKPADIILEMVENWCQNLPLISKPGENEDARTLSDNLMASILRKLSELNSNPRIFDDDMLYDDYLNDELERLIRNLPMCCELQRSKDDRKAQLISGIRSVKPLIRDEKARHEYKKDVKTTITNMLPEPLNTTVEKAAMYKELVDEIADSFVQHNYNRDDYEGKQIYKNQIRDAIMKFYAEIRDNKNDEDPLIKQNKLLCELAKIPIPSEAALKENIEEIKMKGEVSNFLDEVIPDEKADIATEKKIIQSNLSKRLHDLEKSGHSCANDKTMKEEVARSLKKINVDVDEFRVEDFIKKLKDNEPIRKTPPIRKPEEVQTSVDVNQELQHHGWISGYANSTDGSMEQNYAPVFAPPVFYPTLGSSPGAAAARPYVPYQNQQSESMKFYTLYSDDQVDLPKPSQPPGPGLKPPSEFVQGGPNVNYYRPPGSPKSITHHTLPDTGSPPPSEMFGSNVIYYQSPGAPKSPMPSGVQPQQMVHNTTNNRSFPSQMQPQGRSPPGLPPGVPPGIPFDNRFPPRPQTRRQSLNMSSTPSAFGSQRRLSLQVPLKYDVNLHNNRNVPLNYRDVCAEPAGNIDTQHISVRVLNFEGNADSPAVTQSQSMPQPVTHASRQIFPFQNPLSSPQIPSFRRPVSPVPTSQHSSPMQPRTGTVIQSPRSALASSSATPLSQPMSSSVPPSPMQPRPPTPVIQSPRNVPLPAPNQPSVAPTQNTQSTQSYQGFQNAVAGVSSPIQNQPTAANGDVFNNQLPQGTHQTAEMAATPHALRNPPRKKRRRLTERDICECLGRDRRCMPYPEDYLPFWCFMPYRFSNFCYF